MQKNPRSHLKKKFGSRSKSTNQKFQLGCQHSKDFQSSNRKSHHRRRTSNKDPNYNLVQGIGVKDHSSGDEEECPICSKTGYDCGHYFYQARYKKHYLLYCFICKARGAHWWTNCPHKEYYRNVKTPNPKAEEFSRPATTSTYQNSGATHYGDDPNNKTIFVSGFDSNFSEEHLRQACSQFGHVVDVKIPSGSGCGFVEFLTRGCAEEAYTKMHAKPLGGEIISVTWK